LPFTLCPREIKIRIKNLPESSVYATILLVFGQITLDVMNLLMCLSNVFALLGPQSQMLLKNNANEIGFSAVFGPLALVRSQLCAKKN